MSRARPPSAGRDRAGRHVAVGRGRRRRESAAQRRRRAHTVKIGIAPGREAADIASLGARGKRRQRASVLAAPDGEFDGFAGIGLEPADLPPVRSEPVVENVGAEDAQRERALRLRPRHRRAKIPRAGLREGRRCGETPADRQRDASRFCRSSHWSTSLVRRGPHLNPPPLRGGGDESFHRAEGEAGWGSARKEGARDDGVNVITSNDRRWEKRCRTVEKIIQRGSAGGMGDRAAVDALNTLSDLDQRVCPGSTAKATPPQQSGSRTWTRPPTPPPYRAHGRRATQHLADYERCPSSSRKTRARRRERSAGQNTRPRQSGNYWKQGEKG